RHSLSPLIHNAFLERTGIGAVYLTFEFPLENLKEAFLGAKKLGFLGLNITMPFKEHAYDLADCVDSRSTAIGSVNTIKFNNTEGASMGFNTDVDGFTRSLEGSGFNWYKSDCLVLGAGGSAKSSVFALLEKPVKKIYIYNRTTKKAEEIKNSYPVEKGIKIEVLKNLEEINPADMDLICNCTPLGMDTARLSEMMPVPDRWDLKDIFLFEMVYKTLNTRLLKKGKNEGARVIDGLDMLINQAASSFKIWFDVFPETKGIKTNLIDYLNYKN
ncbi:MAG: shikimate dehydrogenase, partial [Actinomycetota bacterium]